MTEIRKSFFNITSGIAGQLVAAVVGLVIPRLILIYYGSETNGLINSVTQIFQYVALLEAGVGTVTSQALYSRMSERDYAGISSCLRATAIYYRNTGMAYLAITICFAVCYPQLFYSEIPSGQISWLICFSGMNSAINFFTAGKYRLLLEADGRKYVWNTINTLGLVLANLAKVFLILRGASVAVMQLGFAIVSLLQLWGICFYGKRNYPWINWKAEPDFKAVSQRYSALIHQISGLIFGSTDMILLTAMCGLKEVSVYSIYSMVMNLVNNLLSQISGSVMYKMGQIYYADKKKFLIYHHLYEICNFVLVFSAFTVAYLFLPSFVRLYTKGITDANYLDPHLPLLFVVIQLLSCGRTAAANAIHYAGLFRKTQNRAIVESVINLGVSIIGIHYLGIYGALLGTIAALLYRTNDMIWYTAKQILHISPWYTYRRWLSCGLVFCIVCGVRQYLPVGADNYFVFLGKAVLCGVGMIMVYLMVEVVVEYEFLNKWKKTVGKSWRF